MSAPLYGLFPCRKGKLKNLRPDLSASFAPPGSSGIVTLQTRPDAHSTLQLRPSRNTDLPIIYNWMCLEYAGLRRPMGSLPLPFEEAYSSISQSDSARAFIGLVDELPVCGIEIHRVTNHAISLYYEACPHDFLLDVQVAGPSIPDHVADLLAASIGYFLDFPEVGRILAEADCADQPFTGLLKEAGFRRIKKINMPYKTATLYVLAQC